MKKINCPYCNKIIGLNTLMRHLSLQHIDKYNEQIKLIELLFYDINFSEKTLINYPHIIVNINTIYKIWQKAYTKIERLARMKKCNQLHHFEKKQNIMTNNNCSICGSIKEKKLIIHIKNYHLDIYEELISYIKQLFYDKNFVRQNYNKYKEKLYNISYSTIYNMWIKFFGSRTVTNRHKIIEVIVKNID